MAKGQLEGEQLTLETLGKLDHNGVGFMIERLLAEASKDLQDRGSDGKPRKVTLTIEMVQLENQTVDVTVKGNVKLPDYVTAPSNGRTRWNKDKGRWGVEMPKEDGGEDLQDDETTGGEAR